MGKYNFLAKKVFEIEQDELLEELMDTVLEHTEITGIPDYSGNGEVIITNKDELLKKLRDIVKQ